VSRLPSLLPRRRAAAMRMRSRAEIAALIGPPFTPERPPAVPAAVACEQEWPRLRVARGDTGVWWWTITGPDGRVLGTDSGPTQPAALALGTAVLELVTMAWALGVGQADPAG
jgi:hypothetical protein